MKDMQFVNNVNINKENESINESNIINYYEIF